MKLYQLHSKQALPISKKEAWDFLSNPANSRSFAGNRMRPGQLAHPLIVKKQLIEIFKHREQKLIEIFGIIKNVPNELTLKSI